MTALKALLERPEPGVGASGINFFNAPAASAEDRRDIVILQSVADALTRLAGPAFAPAFGGSTSLDDYRWGKLHRIVFEHPLAAHSTFDRVRLDPQPPRRRASGFPTDGGFGVVDASNHNPRAQSANEFMFGSGPVNRSSQKRDGRACERSPCGPVGQAAFRYAVLLESPALYLTNRHDPPALREERAAAGALVG